MITSTTREYRKATSIEEMQQVAQNQITFKIYELEERIQNLKSLISQVESVVSFDSYERIAGDVIDSGDEKDLDALYQLAEYYGCMQAGNYF